MDPLGSVLECIIVLVLILLNGLLSMLEMAVVSSRKSRLEQLAEEGSKSAAYISRLAEEPTVFLSTVQIGISLVGIGTGVYSGAMLAAPLEVLLRKIPFMVPYAAFVSYTAVVVLVTYLSLILGELLPKNWRLTIPKRSPCFCKVHQNLNHAFPSADNLFKRIYHGAAACYRRKAE